MSQFRLVVSTLASDINPVTKYVSGKTGLTVVITDVEGFTIHCAILTVTEPDNNEGYVHALEHLIFNGSKKYPHRDILYKLAEDVNAWSDVDHTIVKFTTAGQKCALALLPIFLDHILFPLLSEEDYLLDVHHIDGDGKDGGLVYDEMKDAGNQPYKRMRTKLQMEMYPNSGYSYDYCGAEADLRTSTTNSKVKEFHERYYRPENVTIIITGQINHEDVFKTLSEFEDEFIGIRNAQPLKEWTKPWQSVPSPPNCGVYNTYQKPQPSYQLLCSNCDNIVFPDEDENEGCILFGWRGPVQSDASSQKELTACAILLDYFTRGTTAPLNKCLVDTKLAGIVSSDLSTNKYSYISVDIFNIPLSKLEETRVTTLEYLKGVCSGDNSIDMDRIKDLVQQQLEDLKMTSDWNPHYEIITRYLSCLNLDTTEQINIEDLMLDNPHWHLNELLREPADYWLELFRKYFTDNVVIVMGDLTHIEGSEAEEKERIEKQRAALGEQALVEKAKLLENAKKYRQRPVPSVMGLLPLPTAEDLDFHAVKLYSIYNQCPHFNTKDMPFYTRLLSVDTDYVHIHLMFDTTSVYTYDRPYLPLLLRCFGNCPLIRGYRTVSYQNVISEIDQLMVKFDKSVGFNGQDSFRAGAFGNIIRIEVVCLPENYEKVVNLLYDILYHTDLEPQRVRQLAEEFIKELLNSGSTDTNNILKDYIRDIIYSEESNAFWSSMHRQSKLLLEYCEPDDQVTGGSLSGRMIVDRRNTIFVKLTLNLWIQIASNFDKLKLSAEPWKKFAVLLSDSQDRRPFTPKNWDTELITIMSENYRRMLRNRRDSVNSFYAQLSTKFESDPSKGTLFSDWRSEKLNDGYASPEPASSDFKPGCDFDGYIIGMENVKQAQLMIASVGPLRYLAKDEAALNIALRHFSIGWLHKLSCKSDISLSLNEACIFLSLYDVENVVETYAKLKPLVYEYFDSPLVDDEDFKTAKKLTLYEALKKEKQISDVLETSLANFMQNLGEDYNRQLITEIATMRPEQVRDVALPWLPAAVCSAKLCIVCPQNELSEIRATFLRRGIKLLVPTP